MSHFDKNKTYALFNTPINKKRIAEIEQAVIFPTITTCEIQQDYSLLKKLEQFNWLVFTDIYTVEYFVTELEKLNLDLFELDSFRVLAYGEAVSDRLRFSQLHADVIPSTIKTSDVLRALKDYIFEEDEFEELNFLILKEKNAEIELTKELPKAIELPIYYAELKEDTDLPKLKALLKGGAIDEFIFSSPLDVINLSHLFQTENLAEVLEETKISSTDSQTHLTLEEFRLI